MTPTASRIWPILVNEAYELDINIITTLQMWKLRHIDVKGVPGVTSKKCGSLDLNPISWAPEPVHCPFMLLWCNLLEYNLKMWQMY